VNLAIQPASSAKAKKQWTFIYSSLCFLMASYLRTDSIFTFSGFYVLLLLGLVGKLHMLG
jgi:hypothetical protein